jgi:hypothetical protein
MLSLHLTVEGLLNWLQLVPNLSADAIPGSPAATPPPVAQPIPEETFIELPYRLVLSPDSTGGWEHASTAVTHGDRTELWHTRLGLQDGSRVNETQMPVVRAIWARDFEKPARRRVGRLALSRFAKTDRAIVL